MSVGRSGDVGAVSQHVESSASCETPWPEHPSEVSEVLGHHAPGQQVEAGATHSGAIHLRPTIEHDSVRDRVEHGGTKDGTFLPTVSDPERGVVHNAALGPLAVGVPEVLSPVFQGGYLRSYDDRCAQPKHRRLEASRMSPGAHCSGPLYRQPEVGHGLASLPAELHEGTGPRDQGENSSGGVVPLFGPVRGADPRRGGGSGSDGGVIVSGPFGGSFELSGGTLGSFDKARGYMDGAATASEVKARRCVDEATATTSRGAAEEEGTGQDKWKAMAGHIRCGSSVVGSVGECGASSPVDVSECLTSEDKQLRFRRPVGSLEGDGCSPQGCIEESAAKDSTKVLGSFGGTRGSGYGESGSKGATDSTKAVGGTSYANTPDFGATSTTTTPDFRAASSATAPGISTIASTAGGPWSPLCLDRSNLSERRGNILFPFGGELLYPGTARSGRGKGTPTMGRGPAADSQCITDRPAASYTPGAPFGSTDGGSRTTDGGSRTSGCRDGATGINGDSRDIGEQLSDPRIRDNTTSACSPTRYLKQPASMFLPEIPSETSRPSALCAPPREHAKEASFESVSVGRCDHDAVAAPTMPLQDTSMFDEPNDLREAGRPGDPATELTVDSTELAVDLSHSSADPVVAGESKKALDHRLRGHVPFWGSCEYCSRARGITPARKRQQGHPHEMQLDQCVYKHRFFVVLVHVATFAIAVNHRAEGTSGTETADGLRDWCMHFGVSRERPHFLSDPEPLAISIAERLAESHNGTSEAFPAERHAPVAERAIRTLKGIVATLELELRENGVQVGDNPETLEYLFRYAAHVHNRFSTSVGSTMSPFQKLRGHDHQPHLTYPFGAVVFAKVSKSSREEVDSKYARGVYLGPVLGSTGHLVHIRLDSGETKKVIAPGLKLLYPLRYDASLLEGATVPDGFLPPPDGDRFRELHLPYVPGGGPSKDWVDQHGKTPKCPGCSEAATSSRHSQRCVRRYQKWLRDSIDGTLEDLAQEPPPAVADEPPPKRVRFGSPEIHDIPAPSLPSESDLEVPEIGLEPLDGTSEYEPSLAPEDEEDLMSDVAPEPPEKPPDRLPVRYLEELFECTRFVRNGLSGCDAYDLEAFCNLLVGRSSVEKLSVELERGVDCVSVPVGRSVAACVSGGRSVDSVGWSVGSACSVVTDKDPEKYGAYMPIRDRSVWVSRPRVSYDDVDGIQLDEKESWEGIKTEVTALDSLQVGVLRSRAEIDQYQKEHPGCRVIKSRWVLTQKAPGLVRARLVAKDFAHGRPSALDLGLSSNTASVEALKMILSRAAKGRMKMWGLDISTAFLFANIVQPTVIELPGNFSLETGEPAYLVLHKALYGLRSASLSWQRHLSRIMVDLGLRPSPLEPTLFSGWVELNKVWVYIIALAYVDDLLVVSSEQSGVEHVHKSLAALLKVKVTGKLEDGQLEFLGRLIRLDGNNIALGVKPEYVRSVFSAFGWTDKDLEKVKPTSTTPDIRALYDAEDPESPSKPLTPEAAGRFRSCLGKIGWLTQTRTDITYFHSMLSRGQAAPRAVHEDALRKFLRWLVGCPLLDQIFPSGDGTTLEEETATLVAFCDSNWGSESSTGRKSTSGGVIYIVAGSSWYCVKGYSRLQSVVALSSAEAELFAIAEAAKEVAGLGQLASHIWGELTKPLAIYTDSASARQIAGMEGFLRRMRHVDIRLCFIQEDSSAQA